MATKTNFSFFFYLRPAKLMVNHAQSARTENMNECGTGDLSAININFEGQFRYFRIRN